MNDPLSLFPPHRAAALERLQAFAPKAGRNYGERRNFSAPVDQADAVSLLSPYLRCGLISQTEVLRAVMEHHNERDAGKFIAEVFWRMYWQGWLAMRPGVWDSYQSDLKRLFNDVQTQSGLRNRWQDACLGQTGIAPFDAWAQELAQTGYLHNHARMWFASIWVHTLELPWQLGADFFLRHLLDGCPASNTLSWKWVAGLQTIGKPYLATSENIEKFTEGRFSDVTGLAASAADLAAPPHPGPVPLWETAHPALGKRTALILHEDDLNPAYVIEMTSEISANVALVATVNQTPWQMAPHVDAFRSTALADTRDRLEGQIGTDKGSAGDAAALAQWAKAEGAAQLVTADAPVGPTKTVLDAYDRLTDVPPLVRVRSEMDAAAWPLATKGFFKFRDHIPDLMASLVETDT